MEVRFAHLCDYATISQEGKLSVLGIFSQINATQLPYTHPQAYLAFEVMVSYAELGRPIEIEIKCIDADGNPVFETKGHMLLQKKKGQPKPGEIHKIGQVLGIRNLKVNRAGAHDINIFLNGGLADQVPFKVVHHPQPQPGDPSGTPPA